jgi:predicted ATPase
MMRQCPACSRQFGEGIDLCPFDGRRLVAAELVPGTVVDDRYRVEAPVGKGGLGAVYRATHLRLGRPVAIKVVRGDYAGDPEIAERFEREATTLASLKHPNVVEVYDFGVAPGVGAYLVMELLEGRSLADEIRLLGRLPAALVAELMGRVASAVQAAHDVGIIHRDLKPENIFLETTSEGQLVKVLDFGIAKLAHGNDGEASRLTAAGILIGTPAYMSPEQCAGSEVDARSDVYSLGCVAYEMLTGHPPFTGSLQAVLYQHAVEPPRPPGTHAPDVPPAVDAIVLRALAKRPEDRFQTAAEFGQALAESISLPTVMVRAVRLPNEVNYGPTLVAAALRPTPRRDNLPEEVSGFVGREREIAEVRALFRGGRLVTLVGPGGIGKSRLALRVAEELAEEYDDGAWLVELALVRDPALVRQAVASALDIREEPGRHLSETLAEYLGPRNLMIVLDNCEHLVEAAAELVEELLGSFRGLSVLATSREALNVAGETVWPVPPLSLPGDEWPATPEDLMRYEAVRLFYERAIGSNPSFAITPENAAAVARLCADLDGIPLAIELAAARTRVLTVEQIVSKLDDRFRLLVGGRRTAQLRQQTLRAAIDWSYDLLSDEERTVFARLSVFAGGWTLDAAEAVTQVASSPGGAASSVGARASIEVLDVLTHLVDKSLVIVDRHGDIARYRMLETIRRYAAEKLLESSDASEVFARHRDWYLQLAEHGRQELSGPRGNDWLRQLESEHDNLRAALQWSLRESGNLDASLRLAYALGQFWTARGHPSEGRVWAEEAAAVNESSPLLRANELYWLGSIALAEGNLDRANALLENGLSLKETLGAEQGSALGSQVLGLVAERLGEFERAEALHEQSLTIARDLGDQAGIARALFGMGSTAAKSGDFGRALVLFEVCLEILRQREDERGVALVRYMLGDTARRQGDSNRAVTVLREARTAAGELGLRGLEALSLRRQGAVAADRGERDVATAHYREALVISRDAGDTIGTVAAIEGLACVAAAGGNTTRALKLAGAATGLRGTDAAPSSAEERLVLDKILASARADLGSGVANLTVASGRSLAPEEAVALALAD